jgi:hypothetical protein
MSLNTDEIDLAFNLLRAFVLDLQTPVAIADQSTFLPVLSDFRRVAAVGKTRTQIAVLINRHFQEDQPHTNKAVSHKTGNISES